MCGAHWSSDEPTAIDQIRSLEVPATIHNNCSGKHAGMLVLAALLGTSPDGYAALSHPVQQSILGTLEAMTGIDLISSPMGLMDAARPHSVDHLATGRVALRCLLILPRCHRIAPSPVHCFVMVLPRHPR